MGLAVYRRDAREFYQDVRPGILVFNRSPERVNRKRKKGKRRAQQVVPDGKSRPVGVNR